MWFRVIHLLVSDDKEWTASSLADHLGINYRTARLMLNKLKWALDKKVKFATTRREKEKSLLEREKLHLMKENVQSVKDNVQPEKEIRQLMNEDMQLINEDLQLINEDMQLMNEDIQLFEPVGKHLEENDGVYKSEQKAKLVSKREMERAIDQEIKQQSEKEGQGWANLIHKLNEKCTVLQMEKQRMNKMSRTLYIAPGLRGNSPSELVTSWMRAFLSISLYPSLLRYW
jgi:hypothetical protein